MPERAPVLVHGATGFTGRLVCAALRRRGVPFAIGGRSADKLALLAGELGKGAGDRIEALAVDIGDAESIQRALEGRKVVCACAGPFVKVGEAMLACCARAGVHYVDTTGEQGFAAMAVARYRATAEASGACVVPAMAFEIAPADWAAHLVAERLGEAPDAIDICYMNSPAASKGGSPTTRGTKRSMVAVLASGDARQFVDGALVAESSAAHVRRFVTREGKELAAASFPSPEAVVTPGHTGARTVRTFMAMGEGAARAMQLARGVAPAFARLAEPWLDRAIGRAPDGPEAGDRTNSTFQIYVEARTKGGTREAHAWVTGSDPYGLTAEIQAWAAERALAGEIEKRGVVGPSDAYSPTRAFADLAFTAMKLVT